MLYKKWDVKWRVYDYNYEDEEEVTIQVFDDPLEAARYCIDHKHDGVEMIAFRHRENNS